MHSADQLTVAVDSLARELANGPTLAYGRVKQLCDKAFSHDLKSHLDQEHQLLMKSARSADCKEGILLGLEAATSVLEAAIHGRSSGTQSPFPRLDLVARATRNLSAGSVLAMGGHHHTIDGTAGELHPAKPLGSGNPVPFYLAANRQLVRNVEAGALISFDDIEINPGSTLLALRSQQNECFFGQSMAGSPHALEVDLQAVRTA